MADVVIPNETKDSGVHQAFETGARRDSQAGKGRYDLVSPLALERLALVSERGAAKYEDRNWEKGMPISRFLNSSIRHTMQYLEGRRDEDHLGQACWNLTAALHTEMAVARGILPKELYDLPNYQPASNPINEKDARIRELEASNERMAKQLEKYEEEIERCPGKCVPQDGPGSTEDCCEICEERPAKGETLEECGGCRAQLCDTCVYFEKCECGQEEE